MKYSLAIGACVALSLFTGCASDLSDDIQSHAETEDPDNNIILPGPGGASARFIRHTQGYYQASVNASGQDWVYLDLDTQTQVSPLDPASSDAWDIALMGADIKLNGGSSGAPPSGLDVVVFADKVSVGSPYPWEVVDAAPPATAVNYVSDVEGSELPTGQTGYAMGNAPEADAEPNALTGAGDYGWYHYSGYLAGSLVTARENVAYIIRTLECRYISLRMTSYTDDAGSTKHPKFDLLEVPGAACSDGGTVAALGKAVFSASADGMQAAVDASDEEAWVYLDLSNAMQVAPTDASNDASWDIALKRTDIKMNGGSSGTQDVALQAVLRGEWDSITSLPSGGEFHSDEAQALAFVTYPAAERNAEAACGNINGDFGWYYYSGFCADGGGVHSITPRDVVYLLRGRDGLHWKLRMLSYYDEAGSSAHPSLEFAVIN